MDTSDRIDLESFGEAELRALARERLHPAPPALAQSISALPGPSDFDLNPDALAEIDLAARLKPAAVLVPVVARPEGLSVILTQRTAHLPSHAGQIAFPGGKIDGGDDGPRGAALREAEEEIGLARGFAEPIGYLDIYRTVTDFAVTPVVALIQPDFSLALNREEVEDAFEVPFSFLMDAANHELHTRTYRGHERRYYAMPYGERYIWGATAGILKNMHRRLFCP